MSDLLASHARGNGRDGLDCDNRACYFIGLDFALNGKDGRFYNKR